MDLNHTWHREPALTTCSALPDAAPHEARTSGGLLRNALSVLAAVALALGLSGAAIAQTTSGNSANGAALFTANGCNGCHTLSATDNRINAANASGVITYAMGNDGVTGMGYLAAGVSVSDRNDIAAYIATFVSALGTQTVTYNTAKVITTSDPILSTPNGSFTSLIAGGTAPTKGSLSFSGQDITYTPTAGQTGADSFTYRATGPAGTSSERTINVNISLPGVPTVTAKSVTVANSTATAIDLSTNITSVAPITAVTVVGGPATAHGTTSVAGTTVTYTPTAGYYGTDSFSYTAANSGGTSGSAIVTITVNPAPTTAGAATMTVPVNTATTLDLLAYLTGSGLTGINIVSAPNHGSVTVSGTQVTYTPTQNYFGSDVFTYQAFGAGGTSPVGTVTVSVVGRPDPTQQANVTERLIAQLNSAKRFGNAQMSNIMNRTFSLHNRGANRFSSPGRLTLGDRSPSDPNPNDGLPLQPRSAPLLNNDWQPQKSRANSYQQQALATPADLIASKGQDPGNRNTVQNIGQGLDAVGIKGISGNSINLGTFALGNGLSQTPTPGGLGIWVGGNIRFGTRNGEAGLSHFLTDGVTIGVDTALNDNLVVGLGVGYARDRSTLNEDGSQSNMNGSSIAVYASYVPTPTTFVDGTIGYGFLNYDGTRYVAPISQFTQANRRGDQVFASIAAGYEYRDEGLLISPYGRFDLTYSRLNATTESGGGVYALRYGEQTGQTAQVAFGLRAETVNQSNIGVFLPHVRLEYQRGLEGRGQTVIHYADQLNGTGYTLGSSRNNRNSIVLGLGSDLILRNGLRLSVDYQTLRSLGGENSQAIALRLNKEFGETAARIRGSQYDEFRIPSLGISVDAGYTYDDNVSRAEKDNDKFHDESFGINLRKSWNLQITSNTRTVMQAFFSGEKFHKYIGLSHLTLGGQAELQYRTSGKFAAPTFGVFARLAAEDYQSEMRDGYRLSTGLTYRQPITDRISLFSALSYNQRNTAQRVFDTEDVSARVNLDYKLARNSSLYFTGEYRIGDMTSSGSGLLQYLDMSRAFARDDVFVTPQLFTYRFRGKTVLTTLGYSLPLGPTDALDFSWRRVYSAPDWQPSYISSHIHYIDNQYSMSYLTRF